MPPRSSTTRQPQTELPFGAPAVDSVPRDLIDESPRRRHVRERATPKMSSEPTTGSPASGRASRSVGRPVQAVPRLLVTRKEAAASLGMSLDTFERRVQPVIKLVPCGQLVLVPLRELERWCDDHAHYLAGAV